MAEAHSTSTSPGPISWKEFLETCPPSEWRVVSGFQYNGFCHEAPEIVLELYCNNPSCGRVSNFEKLSGTLTSRPGCGDGPKAFITFRCRHCERATKTFSILSSWGDGEVDPVVIKIGEYPPFGPVVSPDLLELFGADADLFKKGLQAEAQGLGVGAFTYYRRVLNNQKNRLFDKIIEVLRRYGEDGGLIADLERAKNSSQFSDAVRQIKHGIPDVLKLSGGHNPLTILHGPLSEGLHDKTDEECLGEARDIRTVLAYLAQRLDEALKDRKNLEEAAGRILNRKRDSKTSQPQQSQA